MRRQPEPMYATLLGTFQPEELIKEKGTATKSLAKPPT